MGTSGDKNEKFPIKNDEESSLVQGMDYFMIHWAGA
jgi:hypothetical protein